MADTSFDHLKNKTVEIGSGKYTRDTDVLDGAAKDSAVMDEQNATVQFKTKETAKKPLGGQNDFNG